MLRPRYCIANWKMNLTISEGKEYFSKWLNKPLKNSGIKTIFCPSFTALFTIAKILKDSDSGLGAQNVYYEEEGAYTGEVSCTMLKDVGCRWVIIGHSERRHILGESDEIIRNKLDQIIREGLSPILCIGESIDERNNGKTQDVLRRQLSIAFENLETSRCNSLIIAYEPVWAIGTGISATDEMISKTHQMIRNILAENRFNGETVSIIYGGSVSVENAFELSSIPDVDGFLVGGASLNVEKFYSIYNQL